MAARSFSLSSQSLSRRMFLCSSIALGYSGLASRLSAQIEEAASAAGQPMPEFQEELPLPQKDRIGYAVLGLGKYATNQILPAFASCKKSRLAALVSGNRDKARSIGNHYGIGEDAIYGYNDFERISKNPNVQIVYVITPPSLHREFTERAARAGKHVLSEKPMAPTEADCAAMIDACRKAGKKLMIGYRAQYETFNRECIRRIRSGELGTIKLITADHGRVVDPSDPSDSWRVKKDLAGGGSLFDIGIYSLQAARYLTGEEPVEIHASISTDPADSRFKQVEDRVSFVLRFPSGILANCTSAYSIDGIKRFHVLGDKGSLELAPATDYYHHELRVTKGMVTERFALKEGNQFAAQLDHFAECVRSGSAPLTPGEEGLQDVKLMLAIYEAAKTGGRLAV